MLNYRKWTAPLTLACAMIAGTLYAEFGEDELKGKVPADADCVAGINFTPLKNQPRIQKIKKIVLELDAKVKKELESMDAKTPGTIAVSELAVLSNMFSFFEQSAGIDDKIEYAYFAANLMAETRMGPPNFAVILKTSCTPEELTSYANEFINMTIVNNVGMAFGGEVPFTARFVEEMRDGVKGYRLKLESSDPQIAKDICQKVPEEFLPWIIPSEEKGFILFSTGEGLEWFTSHAIAKMDVDGPLFKNTLKGTKDDLFFITVTQAEEYYFDEETFERKTRPSPLELYSGVATWNPGKSGWIKSKFLYRDAGKFVETIKEIEESPLFGVKREAFEKDLREMKTELQLDNAFDPSKIVAAITVKADTSVDKQILVDVGAEGEAWGVLESLPEIIIKGAGERVLRDIKKSVNGESGAEDDAEPVEILQSM